MVSGGGGPSPDAVPVGFATMVSSVDDGGVDAALLHGPVDEGPGRVVTTVGEVRVAVLLPASHQLAGLGPLTVTYANDGGISLGTPTGTTLQIPEGITHVVATITNAVGATNIVRKDVECN